MVVTIIMPIRHISKCKHGKITPTNKIQFIVKQSSFRKDTLSEYLNFLDLSQELKCINWDQKNFTCSREEPSILLQ